VPTFEMPALIYSRLRRATPLNPRSWARSEELELRRRVLVSRPTESNAFVIRELFGKARVVISVSVVITKN